jgi:hypothetical protein
MLDLLTHELQKGRGAIIVFVQGRTNVIEHKGDDKFLDNHKYRQICVAADLIKDPFLVVVEKRELFNSSQRFGHEPLCKIEFLIAADNVLNTPINLLRRGERFPVIVSTGRIV